MSKPILFNEPYLTGKEKDYMARVVDNGMFIGNGEYTKKVQSYMEETMGANRVLLTHSCTAALEMLPLIYDLGPGDEVIIPSYTFVSTASAFVRNGCKVVFCEVDISNLNMSIDDAMQRLTPNTRAIVPVHYGGISVDIDDMRARLDAAGREDVLILEDAAQGVYAYNQGRNLGTMGNMGTWSFHETKNLHCGLGGALIVNDEAYFDKAEDIWERGTNRGKMLRGLVDKYSWVELGSSFYPTEMQAAFLLAQLESHEANLSERKKIYLRYREHFGSNPLTADFVPRVPDVASLNYHSYFLIFDSPETSDLVRVGLKKQDIHAYIGYVPLHSSPYGQKMGYSAADLPLTEEYSLRVLRFPFHNNMTLNDVDRVCELTLKLLAER